MILAFHLHKGEVRAVSGSFAHPRELPEGHARVFAAMHDQDRRRHCPGLTDRHDGRAAGIV